jgi:hypothetical protein
MTGNFSLGLSGRQAAPRTQGNKLSPQQQYMLDSAQH